MTIADDDRINYAATFLPKDPDDEFTAPCLVVAGVPVYAYFEDGVLHVSVYPDDADDEVIRDGEGVPLRVTIGDETVCSWD